MPDYIAWLDITTSRQWGAHLAKYADVWGPNGKGIFWDQIEMEMGTEGIGEAGDAGAPGGE